MMIGLSLNRLYTAHKETSIAMGLLLDMLNYGLRIRWECRERFPTRRLQRKSIVSDPGMHHGTCVTHVPWCISGSLTCGGGGNVPGIPGACALAILCTWEDTHGDAVKSCNTDGPAQGYSNSVANALALELLHAYTNPSVWQAAEWRKVQSTWCTDVFSTGTNFSEISKTFHSSKCIWNCRLQNGGHFLVLYVVIRR